MNGEAFLENRVIPALTTGDVLVYGRSGYDKKSDVPFFVERQRAGHTLGVERASLAAGARYLFGGRELRVDDHLVRELAAYEYWLRPLETIRFQKHKMHFVAQQFDQEGTLRFEDRSSNFPYLHAAFAAYLEHQLPIRERHEQTRKPVRQDWESVPFIPGAQFHPLGPHGVLRLMQGRSP